MFVGKFTKTVDISYNIENFKAKVSSVHDDKHVGIEMSTSRGHAPMPHGKHEQTIDFFGDIVFAAKKDAFDAGQVF